MRRFLKSPWTIGIGTTVIGGVTLSIVLDAIKKVSILSTLKNILMFIWNCIISFLNFEIKLWWLLVAVGLLFVVLWIISKFRPNLLDDIREEDYYAVMKENLSNTLERLGVGYLDTYLLHSARYVYSDAIIDTLNRLKKEGYARKVGVSVYEVDEAKRCIERDNVDFMQLPYSVFDQRMKNGGLFDMAKKNSVATQIHSRSAFIQGLILMDEEQVPDFLSKARPIVRKISELCSRYEISRIALAMNYVKQEESISHLVFGVYNIRQLKEDIQIFQEDIDKDVIRDISREFCDIEADIVMPSLWKR